MEQDKLLLGKAPYAPLKIGTHNKIFHTDDVCCIAFLLTLAPNSTYIRTRDSQELATCDIVVDVGEGAFDHHQENKRMHKGSDIPYSAFGLLWDAFGHKYVAYVCPDLTERECLNVKRIVGKEFALQVDAADNGKVHNIYTKPINSFIGYISDLSPDWDEDFSLEDSFKEAVCIAQSYLRRMVCGIAYQTTNETGLNADTVLSGALIHNLIVNKNKLNEYDQTKITKYLGDAPDNLEAMYEYVNNTNFDYLKDRVACESEFNSVAALIWEFFGKSVIRSHFKLNETQVEDVKKQATDKFFCQIRTEDTLYINRKYDNPVATFYSYLNSFSYLLEGEDLQDNYMKAVQIALDYLVKRVIKKQVNAYYIMDYLDDQVTIQNSPILVLDKGLNWRRYILDVDPQERIKFVVFPDVDNSWLVQVVPKQRDSFESRMDLPSHWGSRRGKELEHITGVNGSIFCHSGLFLCGNKTLQGAIKMAEKALVHNQLACLCTKRAALY